MNKLNQLVIQQFNPRTLPDNADMLAGYLEQVQEEKQLVTRQLLETTCSDDSLEDKQATVRQYQASTTRLLDVIYYHIYLHQSIFPKEENPHDLRAAFYLQVEEVLQEVMIGLEQHFSEFMDVSKPLPLSYAVLARKQLALRLKEVEWLTQTPGLDHALVALLLRPMKEFMNHANERINFRSLFYCRDFLSQLIQLTNLNLLPAEKFDRHIHYILLHLNFNSIEYYLYCTDRVRGKLKHYKKLPDKITCLGWFIKEIRNIPVKSNVALDVTQKHIHGHLLSWLEEERNYLQELCDASREARAQNVLQQLSQGRQDDPNRIVTNLTLPQLALMVRLHIDEGIIANTSTQQVLRFVTSVLAERKASPVTMETFRARYHHPSLATIQSCKATIARLSARLSEYELSLHAYVD